MSLERLGLVVLSALLLGGVAAWTFRADPAPVAADSRAAPAAASTRTTVRTAEGPDYRAEIEALREEVRALGEASPHAAPPAYEPPSTPEEELAVMSDMAGRFDAALAREQADPEWSEGMRTRATEFLSSIEGTTVASAECRASLCRFDLNLADVDAREDLARHSPEILEEGAELFGYVEGPGDLMVTLYVSRGGTALPAG